MVPRSQSGLHVVGGTDDKLLAKSGVQELDKYHAALPLVFFLLLTIGNLPFLTLCFCNSRLIMCLRTTRFVQLPRCGCSKRKPAWGENVCRCG